jgi:DNA (cytosine-5)-methyltransferase 1
LRKINKNCGNTKIGLENQEKNFFKYFFRKIFFNYIKNIPYFCSMENIKFIDLFAGIGGIRCGFEKAFRKAGYNTQCVLTSEIKPYAVTVLNANHPDETVSGDITKIAASDIQDFDFLLAGFPCQAFSYAGKRLGFMDTRGTLFFEVERILREKRPYGFILENVEGLVTHDRANPKDKIGRTFTTILQKLDELGYKVSWRVLNSKYFGLAQERKRIYIVGTLDEKVSLDFFMPRYAKIGDILEHGQPTENTEFIKLLLAHYSSEQLNGKSIKDKRGGSDNIHSWDIELKGAVSQEQKKLLDMMFKERRKKKWAAEFGIRWMDGMPLTLKQISTFFAHPDLYNMLEDLVKKGYLKKEHPKKIVVRHTELGDQESREQDPTLPLGYNIVAGKLSFEISKILSPDGIAPTMVAMDMKKNYVVDGEGLRPLTLREGLRLFGYPEDFKFPVDNLHDGYDLLGNTVAVPVIQAVAERLEKTFSKHKEQSEYEEGYLIASV